MNEHFIPSHACVCICMHVQCSTLTSEGTVGQTCTLNLLVCILLSVTSVHMFVHAISTTFAQSTIVALHVVL